MKFIVLSKLLNDTQQEKFRAIFKSITILYGAGGFDSAHFDFAQCRQPPDFRVLPSNPAIQPPFLTKRRLTPFCFLILTPQLRKKHHALETRWQVLLPIGAASCLDIIRITMQIMAR